MATKTGFDYMRRELTSFLSTRETIEKKQADVVAKIEDKNVYSLTYFLASFGHRLTLQSVVSMMNDKGESSPLWQGLLCSLRYMCVDFRAVMFSCDVGKGEKAHSGPSSYNAVVAADWLALAMAFEQVSLADWCGDRLIGMFTKGDYRIEHRRYNGEPSVPFVIRLFARWRGIEDKVLAEGDASLLKNRKGKHAAHEAVLRAWDSPEAFAKALENLSEYCENEMNSVGRTPAWTVIPFEFLALAKVREDLKLPMPKVKHVFFGENPLAHPPRPFPSVPVDDLLKKVIARCKQLEPKLDVPWKW